MSTFSTFIFFFFVDPHIHRISPFWFSSKTIILMCVGGYKNMPICRCSLHLKIYINQSHLFQKYLRNNRRHREQKKKKKKLKKKKKARNRSFLFYTYFIFLYTFLKIARALISLRIVWRNADYIFIILTITIMTHETSLTTHTLRQ